MRGYFYEERDMASRREQQIEEDLANGQANEEDNFMQGFSYFHHCYVK